MPPRNMSPFFGRQSPSPFGGMQRNPFAGNRLGGPGMPGQFRAGGQMPGFPGRAGATAGRGGGLLSRLFQRGGQSAAANPAAAFQRGAAGGGGSLFKSIANPSSISSFLNNTQNVLKTAQQVGPMIQQIQQVGPLVKNLPAMWKLYRGLKNAPNEDEQDEQENRELSSKDKKTAPAKEKKSNRQAERPASQAAESKNDEKRPEKGVSVPKLFI